MFILWLNSFYYIHVETELIFFIESGGWFLALHKSATKFHQVKPVRHLEYEMDSIAMMLLL